MITKITQAEYDVLPESLKTKFTPDGDAFVLEEIDVEGLKKSKAEILAEKKALQDKLTEYEKFKAEIEAKAAQADEAKMKEAGAFKELEEKLRQRINEVEEAAKQKEQQFLGNLKTERIKNLLAEKGVRPEMTKYALLDIEDQFDLVTDAQGFSLKYKNGIGDAGEIDKVVDGLRTAMPDFFTAKTPAGSGASGSGSNNGGNTKTMARAAFETLSPVDQMSQIKAGVTLTD